MPRSFPKRFKRLLQAESPDRVWPSFLEFCQRGSAEEMIAAYTASKNDLCRIVLSYEFGKRKLSASVPILVRDLESESGEIRYAAAEALGKIGDPRCGFDLDKRLQVEADLGVRFMLIAGLGGVDYRPAIPELILMLDDSNSGIRHAAAWSLGKMNAVEARMKLEFALERETDSWTKNIMKLALSDIDPGFNPPDRKTN
jgi:HEAT repeat protein